MKSCAAARRRKEPGGRFDSSRRRGRPRPRPPDPNVTASLASFLIENVHVPIWCRLVKRCEDLYKMTFLDRYVRMKRNRLSKWGGGRKKGQLCPPGLLCATMGNLIKVLSRDIDNNAGNFFLDFENAEASWSEKDVWEKVDGVLTEARLILDELQAYEGAGEEIRTAIRSPSEEGVQERAWSAVLPLVAKLKRFYQFSHELEASLRCLLEIFSNPETPPTQQLETKQALARQFALILHFTLRFDELKMTIPAIQNDFSYYRRTISRMRINNLRGDADTEVDNELANRMSLFYASATPMLKTLSDATIKFVSDNPEVPLENTTDCLSTMASVCKVMLETPEYRSRFASEETLLFCLRVMVGVIILYDHVHPAGAFVKTSNIDVKGCIRVLREQPATSVEGLLDALRYTTKHLNDEATPKHIRNMLSNN